MTAIAHAKNMRHFHLYFENNQLVPGAALTEECGVLLVKSNSSI